MLQVLGQPGLQNESMSENIIVVEIHFKEERQLAIVQQAVYLSLSYGDTLSLM